MAFYTLEPWGGDKDDWRAGQVCATIANVHRDPKKGKPFSAADFMPVPDGRGDEGRGRVARDVMRTLDGMMARKDRRDGQRS